ncbi:MAG TPA: L,D-transpeptidase [Bacillota bacterium]|jgi:hypothetical protein|nr:L,D-transpeptidase [Bacillota bacterium]
MRRMALCFIVWLMTFFFLWNGDSRIEAEEEAKWRVKINIPAFLLTVYHNGEEWGRFPVAVGKPETPTPQGLFRIVTKVRNPTWYPKKGKPVPPGPQNPLGGYWMGLNLKGYGIHGNNNARSIGRSVSNGCIRMQNNDIKALFRTLPVGTPVEIEYRCFELVRSPENRLYLRTYPDIYHKIKDRWQALAELLAPLAPEYPVHDAALRWLLARQPYGELELPRWLLLTVDGQPFPEGGFLHGGQVYLPAAVNGLWNGELPPPAEAFISLPQFLQESGESVRLVRDGDLALDLRTIRVIYPGKQVVSRGRWQGEPLVDLEQLVSIFELTATPGLSLGTLYIDGRLLTDLPVFNGRLWLGISRLPELNARLKAKWDSVAYQVEIDREVEKEEMFRVMK